MRGFTHIRLFKLALAVVAVLAPASPALAAEGSAPVLNMSVLGSVHTGEPVQFSGSSAYSSSEQLYLTVFVAPVSHCPSSDVAPRGADVVLRHEAVDAFLSITDLSDNLSTPGQWVLCGYLTDSSSGKIAAANVPFVVSGPSGSREHRSGNHHSGKKHHKHHKH